MNPKKLNLDYPKASPLKTDQLFDFANDRDLNQTAEFLVNDLFSYLCEIPDPDISAALCAIAQEKLRLTFAQLDNFIKSVWSASKNLPDFAVFFKTSFGNQTTKNRQDLSSMIAKNCATELKLMTEGIQKLPSFKQNKDRFENLLNNELRHSENLPIQGIADQLKELVDFNQHTIRRRNFKRRIEPIPNLQTIREVYKTLDFDNIHKEKVNSVDICPYNKLLASCSSDGTIKFIDLDEGVYFPELTITEPQKLGIHSLCIDDKHNISYVNDKNLLRVINLSLNHCTLQLQGQVLQELTDELPDQTVQYTADFRHLVFRSGSKQILFINTHSLKIEKKLDSNDKIRDFSVAMTCDYLATASYEALETEIYETFTGHLITKHKFETPVFAVQWAANGIHLVFGGSNGKLTLLEFAKYHDKSLKVLHIFENIFSISSNISAISLSLDSQYVAAGARNGDHRVKVINLWERAVQLSLPDNLHTYNVNTVKFSRNGKFLVTCSDDTTLKVLKLR